MDKKDILEKIAEKKEFSNLPFEDVERAYGKFERRQTSAEDKIKLTRDFLRKEFSAFASGKLLNKNILDKKSAEEILKKHISTKERFDFYGELYGRLFEFSKKKNVSVFDFGAGINGLSYGFFPNEKFVNYFGVEAVGQLVDLTNYYFEKNKLDKANCFHKSLFDLDFAKKIILDSSGEKIAFLFKVVDALESVQRNYSKIFLEEIVPLLDFVVVSFATKSLISKKKFEVKRYWFENFVGENFEVLKDFEIGSERYIVFRKR